MHVRQRIEKGSILASLKSTWQIAHPIALEHILEDDYGVPQFGLDLPRLDTVELPRDHSAWPYLGSRNHDGGVLGVGVQDDVLTLTISDYEAWRFSGTLDEYRGKPLLPPYSTKHPPFPVELRFEGVRELAFFQDQENGKLHRLKHSLASQLRRVDEFSFDQVLDYRQDTITAVFALLLTKARRTDVVGSTYVHDLFVAVTAKRLVAVEHQREAWISHYGEGEAWLWDEFAWNRRERHLDDWTDVVRYVEELHEQRNDIRR
jgi:hypothetical protein